jgi:hypothetical protein
MAATGKLSAELFSESRVTERLAASTVRVLPKVNLRFFEKVTAKAETTNECL